MSFWTRISVVVGLALFLASFASGQANEAVAAISTSVQAGGQGPQAAPSPTPNDCISASPSMKKDCDLHATITEIVAPDSPAFTLLGINPSNVSKPTTPAEFATDVINAFDDNGHFQSGAALDVVPYLVFAGRSPSLGKLVPPPMKNNPAVREVWTPAQQLHGYMNRVLTRTSVSFATIKGTSNPDTSVRMATGLRAALLDKGDPRTNFQSCAAQIDIPHNPDDPNNAKIEEDIKKAIADCRNKAKRAWNATSFTIAGASSWISTDGSTSNMMRNGGGFWASFALGFSNWGQLIVNGRRVTGERVVPPNTPASTSGTSAAFVLQDTSIGGGAFRVGRSDFNAIVEGLYIGKKTAGVVDSYPEFGFGVEKKLAEKVYLELNYRYDVNSKVNTSGILANLKWSFSQEPKLTHK